MIVKLLKGSLARATLPASFSIRLNWHWEGLIPNPPVWNIQNSLESRIPVTALLRCVWPVCSDSCQCCCLTETRDVTNCLTHTTPILPPLSALGSRFHSHSAAIDHCDHRDAGWRVPGYRQGDWRQQQPPRVCVLVLRWHTRSFACCLLMVSRPVFLAASAGSLLFSDGLWATLVVRESSVHITCSSSFAH